MDDWDDDADAYALLEGDEVTVSGRIDDNLYEIRTIEASRVYVGVPMPLTTGEVFIEGKGYRG